MTGTVLLSADLLSLLKTRVRMLFYTVQDLVGPRGVCGGMGGGRGLSPYLEVGTDVRPE